MSRYSSIVIGKPSATQRAVAGAQFIGLLAVALLVLVIIGLVIAGILGLITGADLLPGNTIESLFGSAHENLNTPCGIECDAAAVSVAVQ